MESLAWKEATKATQPNLLRRLAITQAYLPRAPGDDSTGWSCGLWRLGGLAGIWCDGIGGKGWVGSGERKALSLPDRQPCRVAGAGVGPDGMVTMVGVGAVVVAGMRGGGGARDAAG